MTDPLSERSQLTTRVDLGGRVAIVTGGAGGIGLAIAAGLAQAGATTVIADLDGDAAERAAEPLLAAGLAAVPARLDVTDEASAEDLVTELVAAHGPVGILVNNAAASTDAITEETALADWRRVIDVNLTGPFVCSKAVLPSMTGAGYGRIVNVGSIAARRISFTHGSSYTAAKEGLMAFTRHLAYEVAGRGVTVNAINPGPTLTPELAGRMSPEWISGREKQLPCGRLVSPDDVMRAVLFLVSDLSEMVCGQSIDVDAGALLGWHDTDTYFRKRGAAIGR